MAKARGIGGARRNRPEPNNAHLGRSGDPRKRQDRITPGEWRGSSQPKDASTKADSRARNKRVRAARKAKRGAYRG